MNQYGYDVNVNIYEQLESSLIPNFGSIIVSIAGYLLLTAGLYAIAKRRGIQRPWLAWVPVANTWVLGCISDQYRYVTRREEKNKRKILLFLSILVLVACAVLIAIVVKMVPDLLELVDDNMRLNVSINSITEAIPDQLMDKLSWLCVTALILAALSIIQSILMFMAYYDLFASCDPNNKTIYLVLGIFLGQIISLFVFACRNKDFGMPPRRDQMGTQPPHGGMWTPPQQTWTPHHPPVDPWDQNRE